ncbi:hypothetical protein MPL3356_90257 [Mesorhizobium plurifarium]|uniref:Uncharacterized protein n=1 Tax=Mesorhizobium plurifarium TaxID=69974 RepID=A0A090EFJ7_MESPL|nr:hypothetical protein MPL3356_90257 [Mesorhizobium plurifarium]
MEIGDVIFVMRALLDTEDEPLGLADETKRPSRSSFHGGAGAKLRREDTGIHAVTFAKACNGAEFCTPAGLPSHRILWSAPRRFGPCSAIE